MHPQSASLLAGGVLCATALWLVFRSRISLVSHKLLRSPLRSGLFPNYERTRFLRERIQEDKVRTSAIRVVMTAADLNSGEERFFVNKPVAELEHDPGIDASFIQEKVETADDLIKAVVASSAFPLAYEPVEMQGRLWSDGALVAKQPVIPAIRLGADVLFLVMVEPLAQSAPQVKTFLDVAMRAFDILLARNLQADLSLLENVNRICEKCAADLGTRPEQLQVEVGARTYRYLKAFTIRPASPLAATLLDFDGAVSRPLIEQGYRDGVQAVCDFLEYISKAPAHAGKYVLRLTAEEIRNPAFAR